MRLPGLGSDDPAIPNGLLLREPGAGLFRFNAHVFVAGDAPAGKYPGGRQHLDAVADGKHPFSGGLEFPDNFEDQRVIAQVFGGTTAEDQNSLELRRLHLIEGNVSVQSIAGALDVGVPSRLEIVHHQMQAASRRGGYHGTPAFFPESVHGVKGLIGFATVTGNDENLRHSSEGSRPVKHCRICHDSRSRRGRPCDDVRMPLTISATARPAGGPIVESPAKIAALATALGITAPQGSVIVGVTQPVIQTDQTALQYETRNNNTEFRFSTGTLRLSLSQEIHLSTDLSSCAQTIWLQHEQKHVRDNEQILSRMDAELRADKPFAAILVNPAAWLPQAQFRPTQAAIKSRVDDIFKRLSSAAVQALDTPQEYANFKAQVSARCT